MQKAVIINVTKTNRIRVIGLHTDNKTHNELQPANKNQRVLGKITFTKNDLEAQDTIPQGDASLAGAQYGLYAAEDIVRQDQSGTVLYRKGEEIKVS